MADGAEAAAGGEAGGQVDNGGQQPGAAPAGEPTGQPAAQPAADWTAGLSEETRGFVENRKWGSPEDIVKSYQNLEALRGVPPERLVKLPDGDDPEAWAPVYEKLGRPADPNEYEVVVGDNTPDEVKSFLRTAAHKAGLTKQQAKALTSMMSERTQQRAAERQAEQQTAMQAEVESLRAEWGARFEQNWAQIDRAASTLGMGEAELGALKDAMGPAGAARFLHGLSEKLGEDSFAGGNQGGSEFGAMSPAAATARIGDLKADADFRKRLMNGDRAAQDQWDRLHRWAYGNHG